MQGRMRRIGQRKAVVLFTAVVVGLLVVGCGSSSSGTPYPPGGPGGIPADAAVFVVRSTANLPVAGATVFLVPAGAVDDTPFDGSAVLAGTSEDRDEPLEDAVRLLGATFPQAITDAEGRAWIQPLAGGMYFPYVQPGDTEHLPGGDGSRLSVEASTMLAAETEIVLSSQPPPSATYLGTTTCLACHAAYATEAQHAHRLGFTVPGQFTALQDPVRYPDYQGLWDLYLPAPIFLGGTPVFLSDYDPARGFDKFMATTTPPPPPAVLQVIAWLWKDTGSGDYKITLQNIATFTDPLRTYVVDLSYGGAVYKQRNLVAVPGRKGRYPLLQWNSQGDDANYDRTRKVFRDYHMDWFWDAGTSTFKDPPVSKAFEANCAACHFTGYDAFLDAGTGEWLADAANDPNGAIDIDGDGSLDEINVGCEVCHGPGSVHGGWAADALNAGHEARYIVTPENISPSRQVMMCGRCHDRIQGYGTLANDQPLDALNRMPAAGASRATYLQAHAQRKGPALSSLWSDEVHSKSHHQQYSDLLKGRMHRNDRYLTTCSDCHDSHGFSNYVHHLTYDPADAESKLCANCHLVVDLAAHTTQTVGFDHTVISSLNCVDCHMQKCAKTGAGTYGRTLGSPTGDPATDPLIVYWENDITDHTFEGVLRKTNPDVDGVIPGSALPIPYTNACGVCHSVGSLYPKPGPFSPAD